MCFRRVFSGRIETGTRSTAAPTLPPATAIEDVLDTGDEDNDIVEELVVEEISIDGMCGVY